MVLSSTSETIAEVTKLCNFFKKQAQNTHMQGSTAFLEHATEKPGHWSSLPLTHVPKISSSALSVSNLHSLRTSLLNIFWSGLEELCCAPHDNHLAAVCALPTSDACAESNVAGTSGSARGAAANHRPTLSGVSAGYADRICSTV